MAGLSVSIIGTLTRYKLDNDVQQMEYLVATKSNEIVEAIYSLLYKAEALSTLVIQGNGEIQGLDRIAPIIVNSPVIRNILLAPDGVVSNVFPLTGNEALMGFNMLGPGDGNKEARLARDSKALTLGGPFTAVQGGKILVGRLPVFTNKNNERIFWGLVSVTLSYPEALSPVRLSELDNLGFACEIWRVNPDKGEKQIILSTKASPLVDPIEKEFSLLNARWKISISPLTPWYQGYSFYAMAVAGLLFSILIGAIVQNYWEMHQIRASLEHMAMYDALTGLPNRRAAFERLDNALEEAREKGSSFLLGYLDLNDFKLINDTHGHHIGDYVLKETARRITASIPEKQFAARIGGDEFIIILTGAGTDDIQALKQNIEQAMNQDFAAKFVPALHSSLSMGFAVFPLHGKTAEELTSYADATMYECKAHYRTRRQGSRTDMSVMAFMLNMIIAALPTPR